jgi:hypothetical protein
MKIPPTVAHSWDVAAGTDKSLARWRALWPELKKLELRPQAYSRDKHFRAMVRQKPIIFHDFPVRSQIEKFFDDAGDTANKLRRLFRKSTATTLARIGPTKRVRYLPISEVIDKWERSRGIISANDIFYRTEGFDHVFDCSAISTFNILPTAPPRIQYLEVATMLLGTTGCMTDSHSDDPDGLNHSILGRKFWLVWDRHEGQRNGLLDCEYNQVYTQAKFNLATFSRLESARWFTISQGQTLFLPGNLTHKVITVDRYLGISSFYVSLANALSSLSRWELNGAIMITPELRNQIIKILTRQLEVTAADTNGLKTIWGFDYLGESMRRWKQKYNEAQRKQLLANKHFRTLVERISAHCESARGSR